MMKHVHTFFERFREKNQFMLDNRLPEFDYTPLPTIYSHDDLVWHELDASKRYKFTEMFGYDGKFMVPYKLNELTYRISFPIDALIEPDAFLFKATLYENTYIGQSYADILETISTLTFFERGLVKHTYEKRGDSELLRQRGGWYDRATSETIYDQFLNIGFQDWKTDYATGKPFVDGGHWALAIVFPNGETLKYTGACEYPHNWREVQSLFHI